MPNDMTTSKRPWDGVVPESEQTRYKAAGLGGSGGYVLGGNGGLGGGETVDGGGSGGLGGGDGGDQPIGGRGGGACDRSVNSSR